MATAKNRAIDRMRREKTYERKREEVAHDTGALFAMERSDFEAAADDEIGDDLLALIFTCCHPLLSREARVALTLRLLGGLTTAEIASAFLASESTIAQRLVRAKRTLREAKVPFEVPRGAELDERLPSVLEVIYLVFNEGYAASAGEDWIRTDLCEEALRLGRILAELAPHEPEVHGLVALLEIQASRNERPPRAGRRAGAAARPGPRPLGPAADRPRPAGAGAGRSAARPARPLRPAGSDRRLPRRARSGPRKPTGCGSPPSTRPWPRSPPSPIVELNRAVAVAMAFGPEAGLELLDEIEDEPELASYHLLPSVRGDLLEKLGRHEEAASEFKKAAT